MSNKAYEKERREFSKKAVENDTPLLWIVTISAIVLAVMCVLFRFDAGLPWVGTLIGFPWGTHAIAVKYYFKMAQSDHSEGGITFEAAKASNFERTEDNV